MRVFSAWLQLEQVNHVDKPDFQVREPFPEQCCRRQRFLSWYVARCSKHNIRLLTLIVTGPIPDSNAFGAVANSSINVQVLQMALFVRDNYVDVVFRAQAVIGYRQQTIRVRWKIDPGHSGALVEYYIQEARILVCEAVMILTPYR